jgi:hypothetical protein
MKKTFLCLIAGVAFLTSCKKEKEYETTFNFDIINQKKSFAIDQYYSEYTDTAIRIYAFTGAKDSLYFQLKQTPLEAHTYNITPDGPNQISYTKSGITQKAEAGKFRMEYLNKYSDFTWEIYYNSANDTMQGKGVNVWLTKPGKDTVITL